MMAVQSYEVNPEDVERKYMSYGICQIVNVAMVFKFSYLHQ
jgi:hypothetical protein